MAARLCSIGRTPLPVAKRRTRGSASGKSRFGCKEHISLLGHIVQGLLAIASIVRLKSITESFVEISRRKPFEQDSCILALDE